MNTTKRAHRAGDYLSFKLGDELYAIEVLRTKEVVGKLETNSLPSAPDYVDGVMKLRDEIFPVVNLRARLGLPRVEDTERTCVVIVEVTTSDMEKCWEVKQCGKAECPAYECEDRRCWMLTGTHCRNEIQGSFIEKKKACSQCELYLNAERDNTAFDVGVVIDEVCDVLRFKDEDIEDCPSIVKGSNEHFVSGLAKKGDQIVKLLDIPCTFGNCESKAIQESFQESLAVTY
ncbi:MAG: chemotaxis protein CheW [Planctomycetia bacterium]